MPVAFKRFTCGFKIAKLRLEVPFQPDWAVPSVVSKEEIDSILSQPYSYLDRGAQCYVFGSEDEKYVIKLFRFDRTLVHKKREKKPAFLQKIDHVFSACVLAYEVAREETGLVFLHLNLTNGQLPVLYAKGPIGQLLKIPLDEYRFAIQKRVRPFGSALLTAYHSSDENEMKRLIDSFVALIASRSAKGIRNTDPSVSRNFGFLGDRAIEIDFGNYTKNGVSQEWEIARYTHRLRSWLSDNAPEWVTYLDERIANEHG